MKHSHVLALLILSTLLYESQGINRKLMAKAISSTITSKNYMNDGNKGNPQAEMKSTRENFIAGSSSKYSKVVMKSTREKFVAGSSSKHSKVVLPRYQDVIDLAGMDYSPPRRKTPIHN